MLKLKFAGAVFVLAFAAGGIYMMHAAVGAITETKTAFAPLTEPAPLDATQSQQEVQP